MKLGLVFFPLLLISCAGVGEIPKDRLAQGKTIAFDRNQGNCLACHKIDDGDMPGNIGPELNAAVIHKKTKTQLNAMIWDAGRFNPDTSMPPYGRNKVLTSEDIAKIVDYLRSLP
ncbi:MAG: sulfur oxidation c-type cytochrome SoxX [Methylococcales bacterium]